ncbi:hypothetical protein [Pilimelia columellifera]|uniref:Uncharacterized protein n=1 Tax=Pilimelia columellifera subsp. columellifera TaxID=706583 RepID=A0ABN3N8J6_9ACTN
MRTFVVIAAAAVAVGGVLSAPFTADANPLRSRLPATDGPSVVGSNNPGPQYWAKQAKVVGVADVITEAYRRLPGDSGYAGLITDPANSHITLYWHGLVPDSVTQATKNDSDVTVAVVPSAKYSYQRLLKARDEVITNRLTIDGTEVVSAGPLGDGSGLRVGVKGDEVMVAGAAIQAQISTAAGGVSVTVVSENPEISVAGPDTVDSLRRSILDRKSDPAYGGARWKPNNRGGCSEGFTLGEKVNSAMATAAHCIDLNEDAYSWNGQQYGKVSDRYTNRDIAVIRPTMLSGPAFFQPSMFWGDHNRQSLRPVSGLSGNHLGMLTCSSGAYSGTICDIKIVATGTTHCYPDKFCAYGLVDVQTINGGPVWGPGDSGGPISTSNDETLYANGIISGSDKKGFPTYCLGEQSRNCASYGWYAPLDNWLTESGFVLNTG